MTDLRPRPTRSCSAAIVLAGGRSSRMGSSKAKLEWHGSTLLRRVTGIVGRSVDGPVVVVRAPGQDLPPLDPTVEVVADAREGRGPMEGLAAGLAAVGDRAEVAYVSATDVPLLHPAFVRRVVGACADGIDVVLPHIGGHRQPLAATYRVGLESLVTELIGSGRLRPGSLFERCCVLDLEEEAMRADAGVARGDPDLVSVINLNERADYERAWARPAPQIQVRRLGRLAREPEPDALVLRGWTLGQLAAAVGVTLGQETVATVNGGPATGDPSLPLVAGDAVAFASSDEIVSFARPR